MPNWFIIANPAAGGGLVKKVWPAIEAELQKLQIQYVSNFTIGPGHATTMVQEALTAGYRHIIAVGGDGTNHEVINGIMLQKNVPSAEVNYGLLPVGTGNDWIRTYGIPRDWREWLPQLFAAPSRLQDVGLATFWAGGQKFERFFTNVAGLCYDAFVVKTMADHQIKPGNRFVYLWWILRCLFRFQPTPCTISFDGQSIQESCYTINIGICKYSGGGMQFVPQAIPDDGLFGLTIARKIPKWDVILSTPRFYAGTIGGHPKVTLHQSKNIRVESASEHAVYVEADGEFLGECPAEFRIVEKGIRVIVPF
ncbi:MAG TPA: diacylglycerol kinase family lipid kinase [Haliscomenobacter sp.]|mgnify:FL=1|uniref:diacylglycerol/lipid kinase family protein n=1 Tax=Haliscomenobacter sp. TaxID=2717303 RepID=UPI002C348A03|nr:diacylglycerol kinase family protein [Haliscomenobacter sp.]HOY18528.1 diacylglycerol kinase family lipid kinase [Haliscomenobacter sp.]